MNMNITILPPRIRAAILVDDCWIWSGCCDLKGYGRVSWEGRNAKVMRVVYELLIGVIPVDRQLHHTCKNKRCCNPDHLIPVTPKRHMDLEPRNQFRNRTHCVNRHAFDAPNTRIEIRGKYKVRICRACAREAMREHRERVKS